MLSRSFLRSGHLPTLFSAFLYFDISFMVWVMLGALVNYITADLPLSPGQKGLLVATPILGGALLRLPMGILADRWGGRRAGMLGMVLTILPLLLGWLWATSFAELLVVGFLLGMSGASFAVALPLASRWYPLEHQGLALGIAGAGNSGTVLAALLAPRLAESLGWHAVLGISAALVALTLIVFALLAKDSPNQPPPKKLSDYLATLRQRDAWWFCGFYCVTFGGFVGLANFLTLFFFEQYSMSRVTAGTLTAICVFSGSMLRPLGGYLADRFGGARLLALVLGAVALCMGVVATLPPLVAAVVLFVAAMGLLGTGNGIVFQLIPQRFQREIGIVTGVVGAAGGIGGFLLPSALGLVKGATGSFSLGLALFAGVALIAAVIVRLATQGWTARSAEMEPALSS
jgi:NNP family nitrate/nitrite transporter-like MFS transporter